MKTTLIILSIFLFSCKTYNEITYHETIYQDQILLFQENKISKSYRKAQRTYDRLQEQNYNANRFIIKRQYFIEVNIFENDLITDKELKLLKLNN